MRKSRAREHRPAQDAQAADIAQVDDVVALQHLRRQVRGHHHPQVLRPRRAARQHRRHAAQGRGGAHRQVVEVEVAVGPHGRGVVHQPGVEVLARVDRILPHQAVDAGPLVGLAEDVVVAHHQQGRRVVLQELRPGRAAPRRRKVALAAVGRPERRPGGDVEQQQRGRADRQPGKLPAQDRVGRRGSDLGRHQPVFALRHAQPHRFVASLAGVELVQLLAQTVDRHPYRGVLCAIEGGGTAEHRGGDLELLGPGAAERGSPRDSRRGGSARRSGPAPGAPAAVAPGR